MHRRIACSVVLASMCGCAPARMHGRPPVRSLDIQALVSGAQSGARVVVPRGTYLLPKALEIARGDLALWCEPGTHILVADVRENVVAIHGARNVRIENAHLSHLKPLGNYACHGRVIDIRNAEGVTIFNCDLDGCGAVGVYAEDSKNLVIQNCWIRRNTFNALYLKGCSAVRLLANLIEDNANLFHIYDTTDVEAADNLIRNNGGYWRARDPRPGMRTE